MVLALAVWIGGIVFFAFVMAPAAFDVLPTHQLAGAVVGRTLAALHWIGVASGIVFLVAALLAGPWRGRGPAALLVVIMLALTLGSQLGVSRRMNTLQAQMPVIDQVAPTDARRAAFNRLHWWSTRMEGAVLLLGLVVIYLSAGETRRQRRDW